LHIAVAWNYRRLTYEAGEATWPQLCCWRSNA
jgi:hypothetical protein